MYPLEGKHLTREEIRVIVAEAHVWQKRADLRRLDLRNANLIGADLREADLQEANLSGARLENELLSLSSRNGQCISSCPGYLSALRRGHLWRTSCGGRGSSHWPGRG